MINQNKIDSVNLFGHGYWGSKIHDTLTSMGYNVIVIDPKYNTSFDNANPVYPAIVATQTKYHFDLSKKLIEHGYDVFIEKPVADKYEDIKTLINLQKTNQIIMAGHLYLYNPLLYNLEKIIPTLGDIKLIEFNRLNFGRYQTETNILHNIAFHDLTILHHLFNDINVSELIEFKLSNNKISDRSIILGTANTIPFKIDVSWLSYLRQRTITIFGSYGQAIWNSDKNSIETIYFDISNNLEVTSSSTIAFKDKSILEIELEHFFDCVNNKTQPKTRLQDALIIEKIIQQALSLSKQKTN